MLKIAIPCLALFFLLGCNSNNKQRTNTKTGNATVAINAQENPLDFVKIKHSDGIDTLWLNKGKGQMKLELEKPFFGRIILPNSSIGFYLSPNKALYMDFNTSKPFETLHFDGDEKLTNECLKQQQILKIEQALTMDNMLHYPPDKYQYKTDSLYVVQKIILKEFCAKNGLNDTIFLQQVKQNLWYERMYRLMEYPLYGKENKTLDHKYFKFLDKAEFNNPNLLKNHYYREFLKLYFLHLSEKEAPGNETPGKRVERTCSLVIETIKDTKIQEYLLYTFINDHRKLFGFDDMEGAMQLFFKNVSDEKYTHALQPQFKNWEALNSTPKTPDIALENIGGQQYSLEDFKGQYIYIDVWVTWCEPCKRESKYFYILSQKYNKKNLAFISISIDQKQKKWKDYIMPKQLQGNHYRAVNLNKFKKDYQISTIPRFLLIDPNGYLINANAPKPSNPDTKWLEELPNKAQS